MQPEQRLISAPLSGLSLDEYRAALLTRLTHSYEVHRSMDLLAAQIAAERRVLQLFGELQTDPARTRAIGFRHGSQPVGVASFTLNPAEGHLFLWDILIHEPHRRMGFGTLAIAEVEHLAVEARLDRVQLSIEFGNEASAAFFSRIGYRFVAISALKPLI
ncbi:GNAT family N-acetyltransferase [Peteryoungia ipomoeae]|uniref:GNAT family N-acetyltransferase n=1 Tax=Peteryoungia ipomoeae TaxID=1210932 RepID=A0A4S8NU87_9HYPH|nr:GNAT family N-acetyltransferase [Peteryoungia ipomoeae]